MKILVINGPNLNMLGIREKEIYGEKSYAELCTFIDNPAAYTHTSVAILDALRAVALPAVEVHLSRLSGRESFRQISYISPACEKTIEGKGFEGYREAIRFLTREKKKD